MHVLLFGSTSVDAKMWTTLATSFRSGPGTVATLELYSQKMNAARRSGRVVVADEIGCCTNPGEHGARLGTLESGSPEARSNKSETSRLEDGEIADVVLTWTANQLCRLVSCILRGKKSFGRSASFRRPDAGGLVRPGHMTWRPDFAGVSVKVSRPQVPREGLET